MKKIKKLQRNAVRESRAKQRLSDFTEDQLQFVTGGALFCVMSEGGNSYRHQSYPIEA